MSTWQHFALPGIAEVLFFLTAVYCVFHAQKNRIYPAFWQFLLFRAGLGTIFLIEVSLGYLHLISGVHAYNLYFFTYWPAYAIEAVLVLRVLHEMFRHAMRSIPGMQKMGRPIFFWAVAVSVILACASGASGITSNASGMSVLLSSTQVLARSQSVLALCLLSFLAFASRTLGVSFGSRIFGVTFGLGLMATGNLVNAAVLAHIPALASSANIAFECVYLASISIWCVYFLRPEPVRRMVAVPVASPLLRWNEIAQTLGNPAGQVAVSYPPSFMTDVQHLVNNVMGAAGWPDGAVAVADTSHGPIAG
jgi:hypothetical protein